jgi:hypothetical protein
MEHLGLLLMRITDSLRCGMTATMVGGEELTRLERPFPLENFDTEEEANARLTSEARSPEAG